MGQDLTSATESILHAQMQWAKLAQSSNIIPDAYKGKPDNILVALGFGQSMGLSPAESLYRINVIKGKPTMSAELIAAQVRKAGHKLRITKDEKNVSVTATIIRCDDTDYPISVTRDKKWVASMGLTDNLNYKKQPMTMLTWRAISAVAREACSEALYGVAYTPDEMQDFEFDSDIDVKLETTNPESSTPTANDTEAPVPAEVMASNEQRTKVTQLMKEGGVTNGEQAQTAFQALTGKPLTSSKQLSAEDAETLLSAPDLVVSRTKEALAREVSA